MGDVIIDVRRYLELLDLVDSLPEKRRSLGEADNRELSKYKIIIQNNLYFNERQNYLELITNYLDDEASDPEIFAWNFYIMDKQYGKSLGQAEEELRKKSVSTILVDSRAKKFCEFIGFISSFNALLTDTEPCGDPKSFERKIMLKI